MAKKITKTVNRTLLKRKLSVMADKVGNKLDEAFARNDEDAAVELGVKFVSLLNLKHQLDAPTRKTKRKKGRY